MAITIRKGAYADFVKSSLQPGEFADVVSGDPNTSTGKALYICLASGNVVRIATDADMDALLTTVDLNLATWSGNLATGYSSSSGYSVGDIVTYNNVLYRCTTEIAAGGEAWTAGHWTQVSLTDIIPAVDDTLTQTGQGADAKVTGDKISSAIEETRNNSDGLSNIIKKVAFNGHVDMTFYEGRRGAANGETAEIVSAALWSCSSLIPVSTGDVYTLINLMPEKYRFVVRAYSDTAENSGTFVGGGGPYLLNDDLTVSAENLQSTYSNATTLVYENTVAMIKNTTDATKYWSVHVRRLSGNREDGDLAEIQATFKLLSGTFKVPTTWRTPVGDYGFLFGPDTGSIIIDTESDTPTMTISGTCTFKSGRIRVNNPSIVFSNFVKTGHRTFYYDTIDNTIKNAGYSEYMTMSGVEDTIYLGSYWPITATLQNGWFAFNSNIKVIVNGEMQIPAHLKDPVLGLKVLVTGDSICRGGRNGGRGFIGDIGCEYVNIGIGSATISNVHDSTNATDTAHVMGAANIPETIVKYAEQTSADWYMEPDAIIASGGFNDYGEGALLGNIPTTAVRNDTDAAALDRSTVVGGLAYMFYKMITLFPNAHRFFLITHRIINRPWTAGSGGYTMTELHDAIVAVCKLYGVKVIDVYNDSFVSSTFSVYVSPTLYRDDNTVTDLYHIDHDYIHPLALGYRTGYAPLVKRALREAINL